MHSMKKSCAALLCLVLLSQVGLATRLPAPAAKEIKIRGYITAFTSPTSFEIEDYRVTRDQSVEIELDNQIAGNSFKPEDLRVGTLIEIRGVFNEETNELRATSLKVDLKQFRTLSVTAILDRKPSQLEQVEGQKWRGSVLADGRRIRIESDTAVFFKLNKTEKKEAAKKAKELTKAEKESAKNQPSDAATSTSPTAASQTVSNTASKDEKDNDDETSAEEVPEGAGPLESLADIGPGVVMTYEGKEQPDGSVLATKVTFVRNEMEEGERNLWKQLKVKEKPANFIAAKPGELKVGDDKYKVYPNQELQEYVSRLGQSLVPQYQRYLPEGDPRKIPFKFVVVEKKGFNAAAYPNGVIIIHSEVFKVLENEAQLAAVIAHEIAHATQEHVYREMQHHKKKRTALMIGSLFAAGMGYYGVSNMLRLVNMAMVNGYSRTLENQADRVGLEYLVEAGYDPRQAPRVWTLTGKKYGDHGKDFFWSSHDSNTERRSFMMLTIRNSFSELDFSQLKINELEYKKYALLVTEASPKNKQKIKVT